MSDLISRQDAIDALTDFIWVDYSTRELAQESAEMVIGQIPSAMPKTGVCSGCKCLGSYDSDFPCVNCVRITKDYYCGADMRGGDDE